MDITDLGSGLVISQTDYDECSRNIGCIDEVRLKINLPNADQLPHLFYSVECTRKFNATVKTASGEEVTELTAGNFSNKERGEREGDIVITHGGPFHIDEILAVATIDILLKGEYELIRTRDPEIIKTGDYVVDVGGVYESENNKFDHHQEGGAGDRGDGILYSSFGLVWKKFGVDVCGSEEIAEIIDKKIGVYIDADDNGIDVYEVNKNINVYSLPKAIKIFRPLFGEKRTFDEGFLEALTFVKRLLEREILKAKKYIATKTQAESAYSNAPDKRIIVLDEYIPAIDVVGAYPEPLFIIAPRSDNNTWMVRAVEKNKNTFTARKAFPNDWAGKDGEALINITGVDDAIFCHHSGEFLCVAGSKEGALKLAQIAADV